MLAQALVVYWMMGFQMGFAMFLAITYSLALTATAVAVMLGACFSDPKFASALFTLVVIPQMYFSGVFIAIDLLPEWVAWAQYLCSLTYASRLSFAYEFGNCKPGLAQENCQIALESNNVSVDDTWLVSKPQEPRPSFALEILNPVASFVRSTGSRLQGCSCCTALEASLFFAPKLTTKPSPDDVLILDVHYMHFSNNPFDSRQSTRISIFLGFMWLSGSTTVWTRNDVNMVRRRWMNC
jgi:hypothetical protein